MAKIKPHPDPPEDIDRRKLPIVTKLGKSQLYRVHLSHKDAVFFGKSGANRWDDPKGQYGVLYTGIDEYCAFIEVFGHATGVRLIEEDDLEKRGMSIIPVARPLRLVDLRGKGLARIGADSRICDCDVEISKRWSRAFFSHPSRPDGVLYRARHDPSRFSVALFERAGKKLGLEQVMIDSFMNPDHEKLLAELLDHYGFGINT